MAQQSTQIAVVEWKAGTKCDFYDRDTFQWVEAEVIGSFTDNKREWIKVRCGQKDHNVVKGDPTLRKRTVNVIPGHHLKQLQDAATQLPNIAPILQSILPSSSGQGLYEHSSGLFAFSYILAYMIARVIWFILFGKCDRSNDVVQSGKLCKQ